MYIKKGFFLGIPQVCIGLLLGIIIGISVAKTSFTEAYVYYDKFDERQVFCKNEVDLLRYRFIEQALVPKRTISKCERSGTNKVPDLFLP